VEEKRAAVAAIAQEQGAVECGNSEELAARREKVLKELVATEERYVDDLNQIITGYKDRSSSS